MCGHRTHNIHTEGLRLQAVIRETDSFILNKLLESVSFVVYWQPCRILQETLLNLHLQVDAGGRKPKRELKGDEVGEYHTESCSYTRTEAQHE